MGDDDELLSLVKFQPWSFNYFIMGWNTFWRTILNLCFLSRTQACTHFYRLITNVWCVVKLLMNYKKVSWKLWIFFLLFWSFEAYGQWGDNLMLRSCYHWLNWENWVTLYRLNIFKLVKLHYHSMRFSYIVRGPL